MIPSIRAELVKLLRRPVLLWTLGAAIAFGVATAVLVLVTASATGTPAGGREATITSLADAGGATQSFAIGISFAGTLVFVVFIALFGIETTRGTFRTLLMKQPRRVRLLAGKMTALLGVSAAALLVTELAVWVTSRAVAPSQGVDTSAWDGPAALGAAAEDYGRALLWVAGYAALGMMVALLIRSLPLALGVGIAWAGPLEHIAGGSVTALSDWFPGLLLEAVATGGTVDVGLDRALLMTAGYLVIALAVGATWFARRDVVGAS
jgi:ABC-2 type transport system permease protein